MGDNETIEFEDVTVILPRCKFYWFWWVLGWIVYPLFITIVVVYILFADLNTFFTDGFGQGFFLQYTITSILIKIFTVCYWFNTYFVEEIILKIKKGVGKS